MCEPTGRARFFVDFFFLAAFFLPAFLFFVAMNRLLGLVTAFIITREPLHRGLGLMHDCRP